jgi:hypothetical protein
MKSAHLLSSAILSLSTSFGFAAEGVITTGSSQNTATFNAPSTMRIGAKPTLNWAITNPVITVDDLIFIDRNRPAGESFAQSQVSLGKIETKAEQSMTIRTVAASFVGGPAATGGFRRVQAQYQTVSGGGVPSSGGWQTYFDGIKDAKYLPPKPGASSPPPLTTVNFPAGSRVYLRSRFEHSGLTGGWSPWVTLSTNIQSTSGHVRHARVYKNGQNVPTNAAEGGTSATSFSQSPDLINPIDGAPAIISGSKFNLTTRQVVVCFELGTTTNNPTEANNSDINDYVATITFNGQPVTFVNDLVEVDLTTTGQTQILNLPATGVRQSATPLGKNGVKYVVTTTPRTL